MSTPFSPYILLTNCNTKDFRRTLFVALQLLLAPKVLLDYLRPMITIPSVQPTYSCEDDLSIEDLF